MFVKSICLLCIWMGGLCYGQRMMRCPRDTPGWRSRRLSDREIAMTLFNHLDSPVALLWFDYDEIVERLLIPDIEPGVEDDLSTHRGHVYRVRSSSGQLLKEWRVKGRHALNIQIYPCISSQNYIQKVKSNDDGVDDEDDNEDDNGDETHEEEEEEKLKEETLSHDQVRNMFIFGFIVIAGMAYAYPHIKSQFSVYQHNLQATTDADSVLRDLAIRPRTVTTRQHVESEKEENSRSFNFDLSQRKKGLRQRNNVKFTNVGSDQEEGDVQGKGDAENTARSFDFDLRERMKEIEQNNALPTTSNNDQKHPLSTGSSPIQESNGGGGRATAFARADESMRQHQLTQERRTLEARIAADKAKLTALKATRRATRANQRLRQEQDKAYHDSESNDRSKNSIPLTATESAPVRSSGLEKSQLLLMERAVSTHILPDEPNEAEEAYTLKVRLPGGSSQVRRFAPSNTLADIVVFALRATTPKPTLFELFASQPGGTLANHDDLGRACCVRKSKPKPICGVTEGDNLIAITVRQSSGGTLELKLPAQANTQDAKAALASVLGGGPEALNLVHKGKVLKGDEIMEHGHLLILIKSKFYETHMNDSTGQGDLVGLQNDKFSRSLSSMGIAPNSLLILKSLDDV